MCMRKVEMIEYGKHIDKKGGKLCSTGLGTKFTEPKRFNNFVQHFSFYYLFVKRK